MRWEEGNSTLVVGVEGSCMGEGPAAGTSGGCNLAAVDIL